MPDDVLRVMAVAKFIKSSTPTQLGGMIPVDASTDCRPGDNCEFHVDVYADDTTNDLHNDKNSFLMMYATATDTSSFRIEAYSSGAWSSIATITDNTYGEFYALGNWAAFPLYTGFVVYWHNVFTVFGTGCYRIAIDSTILGNDTTLYSPMFCLHEWSCDAVNRTVRFDSWINHKIGSITDPTVIFDFGTLNWFDSIRVTDAIFGYAKSEYTVEDIQYTNGQIDRTKDEQNQKFEYISGRVPNWHHDRFKTYFLQSDLLEVSDFNYYNPDFTIQYRAINHTGNYAPIWKKALRLARVKLEFEQKINNLRKQHC